MADIVTGPGGAASPVPEQAQPRALPRRRVVIARGLAAAADAMQIVLFPLFGEGFASPADWMLDGVMALALTKLVGFHWSYLPSTALELVPGADLAPSWTAAAWLATRSVAGSGKETRWYIAAAIVTVLAAIGWVLWHRHQ
jgi:p-aminobenzoyl-glutamate transporter AbgT